MVDSSKVRRRPKKWNAIEGILFILLVLVTGYILLRSPIFEVKKVEVRGNHFLSADKILAVADIGIGANIFKLDLGEVTANLRLVPMIKEVQVSRSLPAAVVIDVKERRPLGLLSTGEGFIEVDREGIYLQKAGAGTPGLPVITGIQVVPAGPGQVISAEGLAGALAVIGELPEEIVSSLSEIHVEGDGQIKIYTLEGIQCRFGSATEIKEKAEVFSQLLLELRKQGGKVQYIDLSCAGQPVVFYNQHQAGGVTE